MTDTRLEPAHAPPSTRFYPKKSISDSIHNLVPPRCRRGHPDDGHPAGAARGQGHDQGRPRLPLLRVPPHLFHAAQPAAVGAPCCPPLFAFCVCGALFLVLLLRVPPELLHAAQPAAVGGAPPCSPSLCLLHSFPPAVFSLFCVDFGRQGGCGMAMRAGATRGPARMCSACDSPAQAPRRRAHSLPLGLLRCGRVEGAAPAALTWQRCAALMPNASCPV